MSRSGVRNSHLIPGVTKILRAANLSGMKRTVSNATPRRCAMEFRGVSAQCVCGKALLSRHRRLVLRLTSKRECSHPP